MNDLKDHFLQRSIAGLQELAAELEQREEQLPASTFRLLHTIKGTAQTFGLAAAAKLAHELEDVLAAGNNALLLEGIPLLIGALEHREAMTGNFSERVAAAAGEKPTRRRTLISRISPETFNQFSDIEKQRIMSADGDGRHIFCLEVGFDLATFTEDFKSIKEKLDASCEIIATLPGAADPGKISFRIYVAAPNYGEIEAICAAYRGKLERQSILAGGDLFKALTQIVRHCEHLAENLGKDVSIVVSTGDADPGMDTVKVVFDSLLHLLRNAIDHAFIQKGTVHVGIAEIAGGLSISVSDDGRGIDPEGLMKRAREKGLIDSDFAGEPLDLIFLPGLSTAETVSETSGRGVGLDAVRDLVAGAGGTIKVVSKKGVGTRFEVFLPV